MSVTQARNGTPWMTECGDDRAPADVGTAAGRGDLAITLAVIGAVSARWWLLWLLLWLLEQRA
jgi:hypothetical protein